MSKPVTVTFVGTVAGPWRIDSTMAVVGEPLPQAPYMAAIEGGTLDTGEDTRWMLRGVTSNTRYSSRSEVGVLASRQPGLGRPKATRAALIPIRKTEAWWALAQDERRSIFEETSRHIQIGLAFLPAVARRLHHSRELGEPFDFLTWFEYAPEHREDFEALVRLLRATPEWDYVDREVDVRLTRVVPAKGLDRHELGL